MARNFGWLKHAHGVTIGLLLIVIVLLNVLLYSSINKIPRMTTPTVVKHCENFGQFEYKEVVYLCSRKHDRL